MKTPPATGADPLPTWNLDDLYTGRDAPELAADLEAARTDADTFEKEFRGKLAGLLRHENGAAFLAGAIARYEQMQERLGRIISYAGLLRASDTADMEIAKFYGGIQDQLTRLSTHLLFFELELNRIGDAELEQALADKELAHYRPWLDDIRIERPHQLDDTLEKLFMEKSVTGAAAWNRLFNDTITALRFEVDGEKLALEPTLNLFLSEDEARRKSAAMAVSTTLNENERLFALITNTLAKDKAISDEWRHFDDVADSRHLANRVEGEVVNALEQAVVDAYPRLSHRYYALKARWLGKDTLNHWDRNAPLPEADTRTIGWDEARRTVLDAYAGFSPRMAELAEPFFERGWIDAPVRPGKSPGAFSHPTVPGVHPYILLNYLGKPRDVMTLAHELGHGVHQRLAAAQGALMAPTPLTLAETASVFGEMLTFRALLEKAESKAARKSLLAGKVEDMINTVVRQIAFYRFERKLHLARREAELTPPEINELWLSVQGESLGPAVTFGEDYGIYWAYVPHFIHSPFYVYAYAFGDCLVNSLYARYQARSEGFEENYFSLLGAGGSKRYDELLKPFGLDARKPSFWAQGLSMISGLIDELEAM